MWTVKNKWNGKMYKVIDMTDDIITLEREDGSRFSIPKKEYYFNYSERK